MSGAAGSSLTRSPARMLLLLVLGASILLGVRGQEEEGLELVVPSTTALPSVAPPSSFNRSFNNILPLGTSPELAEALPNRLHTNKFYSNFLVSDSCPLGASYLSFPIELGRPPQPELVWHKVHQ